MSGMRMLYVGHRVDAVGVAMGWGVGERGTSQSAMRGSMAPVAIAMAEE